MTTIPDMFHHVVFRAHCHATEDEEKVRKAMLNIAGIALRIDRKVTTGYYGNEIIVLTGTTKSRAEIGKFWQNIRPVHLQIRAALDELVDDDCVLHLRFDKQQAYAGNLVLRYGSDVVAVKCKVKCYPANQKNAIRAVLKSLETPNP